MSGASIHPHPNRSLADRSHPRPQQLDSVLSALTHHRTSGSVLIRQNVLRPLPALLHKCGSSLRSSLDSVVPHLASALVDVDMGVRTLAAHALLELLTVVRASVVVPALLSRSVLSRSVRVREAVLLLLAHALHQRDPPPGEELPTACLKELGTLLKQLDDPMSLPAQASLSLIQEVAATNGGSFRPALAAAGAPVEIPRGASRLVLARLEEVERGVAPYLPPMHVAYPPPPAPPVPQPPTSAQRGGAGGAGAFPVGTSANAGHHHPPATPRHQHPPATPSSGRALPPHSEGGGRPSVGGFGGGGFGGGGGHGGAIMAGGGTSTLSQSMAAAITAAAEAAHPPSAAPPPSAVHHPFHAPSWAPASEPPPPPSPSPQLRSDAPSLPLHAQLPAHPGQAYAPSEDTLPPSLPDAVSAHTRRYSVGGGGAGGRRSLAAADDEFVAPPSPVRVGSAEEAGRELKELARELRQPQRQDGVWKERAAAMRRLHGLLLGTAPRLPTFGILFHTHMVEPLSLQLKDLRSKCVKLACDVIVEGARVRVPTLHSPLHSAFAQPLAQRLCTAPCTAPCTAQLHSSLAQPLAQRLCTGPLHRALHSAAAWRCWHASARPVLLTASDGF